VRGRRVFCSNRGQRRGCGRTFSVLLGTAIACFVVRTLTLFRFARAVVSGVTRRAAWVAETAGVLSLSSGYRLWRRLQAQQSALRVRLCRTAPAPVCGAREPLAELLGHLRRVVEPSDAVTKLDGFAAYQAHEQRGLLDG